MAITVTGKNYTSISTCEATTGWTGNGVALDNILFKEGSNSLSFVLRTVGNNDIYYAGSWNLTGKHVRLWFIYTAGGALQTYENGGIQMFLYDGTNTAYYYMLGKSGAYPYPGGWYNLCLDCGRTPTSGSVNLAAVTRIGVRLVLTAAPKNAANTWVDNLILCDGLIAKGDLAGGYFSFEDISALDDATTGAWGVIRKIGGVYFLTGSIDIGGDVATKFQAKNQTVVFEDRPVSSTLYAINATDDANAAHTTEFILGSKSGTAGIEGCVVRVQSTTQTPKFTIDGATDTDVDNFKLYGSTFLGASSISTPPSGANVETLNCNFNACGEVLPSTSVVKNCNFVSATDIGVRVVSPSHQISYCSFIACPHGANFATATGTHYNWSHNTHTSNTYDARNATGGSIIIDADVSNIATVDNVGGGSSTTINSTISLTISGFETGSDIVVYDHSTGEVITDSQEEADSTFVYGYPAGDAGNEIDIGVFKVGYIPLYVRGYVLGAASSGLPVSQVADRAYIA